MILVFYLVFVALILSEFVKGLSANGTPPVLQKYPWQLDLAYVMWSNIKYIRVILVSILIFLIWKMTSAERSSILIGGILLTVLWAFIYWLFNLHWVGKYKFDILKNPKFKNASENKVALSEQIMGVDLNGVQKAYPVSMIFYHHQLSDTFGHHPVCVTYCGMCRSGRVYDSLIDGEALHFSLVGAVTFNAILRDSKTKSWWRQETGEAVKGKLKGTQLKDVSMEQMSLENWLAKHPRSDVLQYDPNYQNKYDFLKKLMNYEASFPAWFRQETPPLVIGVAIDNHSKAYDWKELQNKRIVQDTVGDKSLLLLSSEDGTSPFVYDRKIDDEILDFELNGDSLTDINSKSTWNLYGHCTEGKWKGKKLSVVQNYQQFIRAWVSFHPDTTFYDFNY